jgi:hypothetical protein
LCFLRRRLCTHDARRDSRDEFKSGQTPQSSTRPVFSLYLTGIENVFHLEEFNACIFAADRRRGPRLGIAK